MRRPCLVLFQWLICCFLSSGNNVPVITADSVLEVILGEEGVLNIVAVDDDEEDTVELILITEIEGGVLDMEAGEFRWTPTEFVAIEMR